MDNIKLIIWDLDETFWKGTLSEGSIKIPKINKDIINILTDRGIMSSICSKNNFEKVKEVLEKEDLWDLFIFPKIGWNAKGNAVKDIIHSVQVREQNVLFIDDNVNNLSEVEFYNLGIHAETEKLIPELLSHEALQGKNDKVRSRLQQYKILEKKSIDSRNFEDNVEFLMQSELSVYKESVSIKDLDRIYELCQRTNQLNYTKIRSSYLELKEFICDCEVEFNKILVTDKYGDYGLCGYYVYNNSNNALTHFVFSCRILNLGIEQYLYAHLNYPKIKVVPEVAIQLKTEFKPTWINLSENFPNFQDSNKRNRGGQYNIVIKGGCDLQQMMHYLRGRMLNIHEEVNTVVDDIPFHMEHSVFLKSSLESNFYEENVNELNLLPFVNPDGYRTKITESQTDIVVYSLLMDYTQYVYRNKNTGIEVAYGGEGNDILSYNSKSIPPHLHYINPKFVKDFSTEWELVGRISPEGLVDNLRHIRKKLGDKYLILINGSECGTQQDEKSGIIRRHAEMNQAVKRFAEDNNKTFIVDVAKIVQSHDQLEDSIRHYKRSVYKSMSKEIIQIIGGISNEKLNRSLFSTIMNESFHMMEKSGGIYARLYRLISRIRKMSI